METINEMEKIELIDKFKILKLKNMKMKKRLKLAMRIRALNRTRLEGEIAQLNEILYKMKKHVFGKDIEHSVRGFLNPKTVNIDNKNRADDTTCTESNSENFTFFCDRCEFKSCKKTAFDIHVRRHSGVKPFKCNLCDKRFVTNSEKNLHKVTHFNKHKCEKCGQMNHITNVLIDESDEHVTFKNYVCKTCGFENTNGFALVRETTSLTEYERNKCMQDVCIEENTNKVDNNKSNQWICDICEMQFKMKKTLKRHMQTHTGNRPFSCDRCEYAAASKNTLVIHKRSHTGEKPYVCTYCTFRCSTKGYYNIHINKHLGIKRFVCDKCDYRSVDSCKLASHRKIHHSVDKPYMCENCPFRAKLKSQLKKHSVVHGTRPFICHYCAKAFTTKRSLIEHEGIHTGDQPFQCELCKDKRFTLEVSYRNHLNRHKPTYPCKLCDYVTNDKTSLQQHSYVHLKNAAS